MPDRSRLSSCASIIRSCACRPDRFDRARSVTAAVLLCVGAVAIVWWLMAYRPDAGRIVDNGTTVFSIAVLPFTNLSSNRDEDYLADGISEDLTTDLSHLDGAVVIARESAFTYGGKRWTYVMSVGSSVSAMCWRAVFARLAMRSGSTRSSSRRTMVRMCGLIGSISHRMICRMDRTALCAALDIKFDRGKQQPKTSTPDPSAYDLVLRARAVMQERLSYVRNVIAAGYSNRPCGRIRTRLRRWPVPQPS